jgi:hypothetical protein
LAFGYSFVSPNHLPRTVMRFRPRLDLLPDRLSPSSLDVPLPEPSPPPPQTEPAMPAKPPPLPSEEPIAIPKPPPDVPPPA